MKKVCQIIPVVVFCLSATLTPAADHPAGAFSYNPNYLISDNEFINALSMDIDDIQYFLDKGYLGDYTAYDIDGVERSAAEIIARAAIRNGINPQVILVTLQKEQSLVTDPSPSKSQLDWAMGYGICDNCSYSDPGVQKYRGLAKQINSASLQFIEGYFGDIEAYGETVSGFAPGKTSLIDGVEITPYNSATAALYTFTPHLHGNLNFVKLWQKWFIRNYPTGSLLQNAQDGGVWLIQFGERRPITSRAAFTTRYNENAIIVVAPEELDSYPIGKEISLPNYSLLKTEDGRIYLLVDDDVRHIVSMEAFRSIGFNPDEIIDITLPELENYGSGEPIMSTTVYPQGALLQNPANGGIFYAENGTKFPVMSREILNARFAGRPVVPAGQEELDSYPTGDPVKFPDGTLIAATGSPDVFVVSEGNRLPIPNEKTFLGFGWQWEKIVWTNERSVLEHPLGEPISLINENEPLTDVQIASE